jgi:hypothetical protein
MRLPRRKRIDHLSFPTHLETAEQTRARMEDEQAVYVSKHWTRR